jgi:CheY-like chemotaxis protein
MAEILQAIAAVLWPIIVIVLIIILIVMFKPSIASIIDSAKSRKFTLKVGGQELTMEEANKQQQNMITDVQNQVLDLRNKIEHGNQPPSKLEIQTLTDQTKKNLSILWVDDHPRNNSYYVQQLSDLKIHYDLARSTSDGLSRFKQAQYTIVISDMGRREEATAGLNLLNKIRAIDSEVLFIIFTVAENVRKYRSKAEEFGATLITTSWTEIMGIILKEYSKGL